jgi:WD40 repeat protein
LLQDFDIQKYRCHHTLKSKGYIFGLKYLGDDLLASCDMSEIRIWNAKDGSLVKKIDSDAFSLFVLKGKRMMVGASRDPFRIRAWNMQTFNSIETEIKGAVISFEELQNGHLVCAENVDKCHSNILVFNVSEIKIELVDAVNEAHAERICALQSLADNKLASGSYDRTIKIWSNDLKLLRTLKGHNLSVISLILLPDGHLLSGSIDKSMRVWNYESGDCVRLMQDSKGYFEHISLANENTTTIACRVGSPCENYSIQFFNHSDLKCVSIVPASFIHANTRLDHFQVLDDNSFATVSADTIKIFDFQVSESRKNKQCDAGEQPKKKMRFF